MILFSNFISKFPEFTGEETKFNLFMPDVLAEINIYNWGTLKNTATELLIAHKISITKPTGLNSDYTTGTLRILEVDDESYRVELQELSDNNYALSKYGLEYQRLLKIATNSSDERSSFTKGTSITGTTGTSKIKWSQH
ncbi:MAG: hypothetical protein ACKPE3_23820 [Sphaerospermopsis kisseleviana]